MTGGYTLLLKVKTRDTQSLERLIQSLRSIEGVERTETSVVLSTKVEKTALGQGVAEDRPTEPAVVLGNN